MTGMLPTARKWRGTGTVRAKLALKAGSSQHGNIRRASAGSSLLVKQPLHAAVGRIIDKEEAAVELVDPRRELDPQPMRARGQQLRESEGRRLGGGIERDVGALRPIIHGHGSKRGVDGVEGQPCCRFAHLDVDHFDAGKREALGIRSQLD